MSLFYSSCSNCYFGLYGYVLCVISVYFCLTLWHFGVFPALFTILAFNKQTGRLKTRDLTSRDHRNCGGWHRETGQLGTISQGWTSRDLVHCARRSSLQVNICCMEYYMSCASVVCVYFYLIPFNYSHVASYSYMRQTKWAVCVITVWAHY